MRNIPCLKRSLVNFCPALLSKFKDVVCLLSAELCLLLFPTTREDLRGSSETHASDILEIIDYQCHNMMFGVFNDTSLNMPSSYL